MPNTDTTNDDVRKGRANGTQYILKKVWLKHGETVSTTIIRSRNVQIVRASQIAYLESETKGKAPKTHKIRPVNRTFTVDYPLPLQLKVRKKTKATSRTVTMRGTQFSVVSNDATTGWKLQGASVDTLFAMEMTGGIRNWTYVMLSRVRELRGLFLDHPISEDPDKYRLHSKYLAMMTVFNRVACPSLTVESFDLDPADGDFPNDLFEQ